VDWVGEVDAIRQFCFAMGILGSARRLLGNQNYSQEREENPF